MLNAVSLRGRLFLQCNIKEISRADFHTILNSNVQLKNKVKSTEKYEGTHNKADEYRKATDYKVCRHSTQL
jgi:hypothetical protein